MVRKREKIFLGGGGRPPISSGGAVPRVIVGIPDTRGFHLAFILERDVHASHDGLENVKSGPSLGCFWLEVINHRGFQFAVDAVLFIGIARVPIADLLLGERAPPDGRLGARASDTPSERAPELGRREARSDNLRQTSALGANVVEHIGRNARGRFHDAGSRGRDGERARQQRDYRGPGREGAWGGHRGDGRSERLEPGRAG